MMGTSAQADFMRVINDIRAHTNNPHILDATYELEVFSMAMWPSDKIDGAESADRWAGFGFTPAECRIMDLLLSKIGKTVSLRTIMNFVHFHRQPEDWPEQDTLKVQFCRLRRKIEKSPYRIETTWSVGYRLVLRVPGEDEKAKAKAAIRDRTAFYNPAEVHSGPSIGHRGARLSDSDRN